MATQSAEPVPAVRETPDSPLIYRTKLPVRIWHWINAFSIFVMLMSGMMIFNAHPMLYSGQYGANLDTPWLVIGNHGTAGFLSVWGFEIPTTGVLGYAEGTAEARQWHFFFAWSLVLSATAFLLYAVVSGHLRRDLALKKEERSFSHLRHDMKQHARLRFPTGEAARSYNPLQKIAYLGGLFVLITLHSQSFHRYTRP